MQTILIYSGGIDSTTLLYQLLDDGHEIKTLSVDYGQRHHSEIDCAIDIARSLGVEHEVADIKGITHLLGGSSLTSPDLAVPDGHYEEESMKQTIVPNRNMIMLAIAAGWAISHQFDTVSYAAHSGDHAIYPDCREEFAQALDKSIQLADWHQVSLHRPFVGMTKADIITLGTKLKVPYEKTWSCYKGGKLHCGRCGTCIERREAFYLSNINDPTLYESSAPSVSEMVDKCWKLVTL